MRKLKRGIWLIPLLCWASLVFAAPPQEASSSAVREARSQSKKVSTNPQQDYEEGLKLFDIADKRGDLGAFIDATEHFRLAAEAGHAGAQASYGLSLERGQLHEEAIKYYRLSAAQGHMDGQFGLGSVYLLGEGVTQDLVEARKWLVLAGEQGHKAAINLMAEAYIRRDLPTEELAKFRLRDAENYRRSGLGLDEAARQSPDALVWIKRAADNDFLPAMDALAAAYQSGQFGLAVDTQKSDAIVARANKLRGITPKAERKKSALYRFLRGDDSEKSVDKPK